MKKIFVFLFLCMGLGMWNGCQTYHGTKFAPLEATLEAGGDGGARSLALVNSSGQALHNVQVWGKSQLAEGQITQSQQPYQLTSASEQPLQASALTYSFEGSAAKLDPGEAIHFRGNDTLGESRVLESVTKVQITGSCDEGEFRETLLINGNGQLELVGVPKD